MADNHFASAVRRSSVIATATATAAVCTATTTAPNINLTTGATMSGTWKWVVTSWDASASAAPLAAVTPVLQQAGVTIATYQEPATVTTTWGRIYPTPGLAIIDSATTGVSVPSLGAAIVCSVNVYGLQVQTGA